MTPYVPLGRAALLEDKPWGRTFYLSDGKRTPYREMPDPFVPYYNTHKLPSPDADFYSALLRPDERIDEIAIKIFTEKRYEGRGRVHSRCAHVICKTAGRETFVKAGLWLFPVARLGKRAIEGLNSLNIYSKDGRGNRTDIHLPEPMMSRLAALITQGSPIVGFGSLQFIDYMHGVPPIEKLEPSEFSRKYTSAPWSRETVRAGDAVLFSDDELTIGAIYLGKGLYLWQMELGGLTVSTVNDLEATFGTMTISIIHPAN